MDIELGTDDHRLLAQTGHLPQQLAALPATDRARTRPNRLRHRHVLVVGSDCEPEPNGITPHTTGLAEHLATLAASVSVLTGRRHDPHSPVDARHAPRRRTALTRATREAAFLANAWLARHRRRPDLVIAVTPSLGGAAAAARIAERHDAALLVVVHDLVANPAGQSGIRAGTTVTGLASRLEGYALRRADRVAVVSEALRERVVAGGVPNHRISLLPNWTPTTASLPALDDLVDAIFPDPTLSLSQTTRRP